MSMWPSDTKAAAPLIAEAIRIFGAFRSDAVDWLVPFVLANAELGDWKSYKAIVRGGEPVPPEVKATTGLPAWFEIGWPCWTWMTDAGRRDPKEAVDQVLQHVFWHQRLIHRRAQFADVLRSGPTLERPLYTKVTIRADHLCCTAARSIAGMPFPYQDYPDLPLRDCDQVWCKCDWRMVRERR